MTQNKKFTREANEQNGFATNNASSRKVLLKSAFIFVTETNPGKPSDFMYYMISHIKKLGYLYISVASSQR